MGLNNAKRHLNLKVLTRSNVQITGLIGRKIRCFVALTVKTMSDITTFGKWMSVKRLKTIQKGKRVKPMPETRVGKISICAKIYAKITQRLSSNKLQKNAKSKKRAKASARGQQRQSKNNRIKDAMKSFQQCEILKQI